MAEHTQGPLHAGGNGTIIYDQHGWGVANATIYHVRQEPASSRANARRLVACWNACDGKSTEVLEAAAAYDASPDDAEWEAPHPIFQMAQQIDQLNAQRNQLLAALEAFPGFTDDASIGDPWIEQARAAIAAAKTYAKAPRVGVAS